MGWKGGASYENPKGSRFRTQMSKTASGHKCQKGFRTQMSKTASGHKCQKQLPDTNVKNSFRTQMSKTASGHKCQKQLPDTNIKNGFRTQISKRASVWRGRHTSRDFKKSFGNTLTWAFVVRILAVALMGTHGEIMKYEL